MEELVVGRIVDAGLEDASVDRVLVVVSPMNVNGVFAILAMDGRLLPQ